MNAPTTVETTAREMGWRPQEEFRGDTAKWVDAETFVSRGEHFLPIIKADRDRLRAEVANTAAQLAETKQLFTAAQEAIAELRKFHDEDTRRAVDRARKDLVAELKSAREQGDVDREVDVQSQITKIDAAKAAEPPAPAPKPAPAAATETKPDPDFIAWEADNQWFKTDSRKHALAMGIAEELRKDPRNATLTGRKFYDRITEEVDAYLAPAGRPNAKVGGDAGGRQPGGGPGKRSRSYADLPEDARLACETFAKKLVGPGRAYKDMAAWQAQYTTSYFAGDEA